MNFSLSRPTGRIGLTLAGAVLCAVSAQAQVSRFATSIVTINPGPGNGLFDPQDVILGGPNPGDFTNVLSLGVGGDVTLGFDLTITDGPGADFVVYENPFAFNGQIFPEMAKVEVSTNGVDFAQFPMRYDGPQGDLGAFGLVPWGSYSGMAGSIPVLADVLNNTLDPLNPVEGGGDAFDLADLAEHALVQGGLVDLSEIHFVRLTDLVSGTEVDSRLVTISDSGGPDNSTDIDGVGIIHDSGSLNPMAPVVDFWRDDLGYVWLELSDPNGFSNIDLANVRLSANLEETYFFRIRSYFQLASSDANGILLRSPLPMFLEDFEMILAVSATDMDGNQSVDQISLNR